MASYSKAVTGTAVMARSANEEKKKGLCYGHVHCLLFTVTDAILHSLSVHPSLFDALSHAFMSS